MYVCTQKAILPTTLVYACAFPLLYHHVVSFYNIFFFCLTDVHLQQSVLSIDWVRLVRGQVKLTSTTKARLYGLVGSNKPTSEEVSSVACLYPSIFLCSTTTISFSCSIFYIFSFSALVRFSLFLTETHKYARRERERETSNQKMRNNKSSSEI